MGNTDDKIYKDDKGYYTKDSLVEAIIKYSTFSGYGGGLDDMVANAMVQIGQFIPNPNGFNIRAALKRGVSMLSPISLHKCALNVRLMLEAGGINTTGHPTNAYEYANFLPHVGFRFIASLNTNAQQIQWSNSNAIAGDIAVMPYGQSGHICMYTGKQWISDFPQNRPRPYPGDGIVNIFRFERV